MLNGNAGENLIGIEKLKAGETLKFRPSGNSMKPRINHKDLVTVSPLLKEDKIEVNDVVLCKVHGRVMLHLVKAVRSDGQYQIGNNHGRINGWTNREHIYGKLIKVE